MTPAPTTDVRLTELLAALSIATDLGMGQPLEFALQSCVLALRLAERLGLDAATIGAIRQVYARWDGKGIPPLNGEAIAPGMLLVSLAQDTVYAYRLDGVDAAVALAQKRKGTLYAPKHVEVFVRHARTLFADLDADPSWAAVLALDPGRPRYLSDAELDAACAAIADFADIKAPFLLGHSPGVARLAEGAARRCGLPEADVVMLRRAALLHDLGRVGVSAGIWCKPGPLSERDWEQVRLHAYHTERILARPSALAQLGAIASFHHERLDGSGYHRGTTALTLAPSARILAAADAYHALTEQRPHRPVHSPEQAAELLKWEVQRGRLDTEAVSHVLAAAGQRVARKRKELVAGLSEREVEVLRLIAHGLSIKQIAQQLTVAPKTVDNHIQHIYAKIGVTTRAGATLFATEHQLL